MKPPFFRAQTGITVMGGGSVTARDIALARKRAPHFVAADGGANLLLDAGIIPEAVIGDFDSISSSALAQIPKSQQLHISEQLTTDFDKVLRHIEAPFVLALGFTGARIDHGLAVMNTLVRFPQQACILLGAKDVTFALPPGRLELDLAIGDTVSLFPMCPITGQSEGLKWPIDGIDFAPDGMIGTSNEASARKISVSCPRPGMLMTLPRARLDRVIKALRRDLRATKA